MMTRIKVCGMTRPEDAQVAAMAGADAIGFIFAPSPRRINPEQAKAIRAVLPPFVSVVGVFVDHPVDEVLAVARTVGLDAVQLHGSETPADCAHLVQEGLYVVKAFRVKDQASLHNLEEYEVQAFLLDTYVPGRAGGTGKTFDWSLAADYAKSNRVILAGGLNPLNIREALEQVAPFAVDVSSGIEMAPGVKDHDRLQQFIKEVKQYDVDRAEQSPRTIR